MNSVKPLQWAGIVLGVSLVLYFIYFHLQYFGDVTFLGGILLLEVIIASLWKYDQRFFVLLMIAFVWAGMHVPLQGAWTIGRWVVLSAGAVVGLHCLDEDSPQAFRIIPSDRFLLHLRRVCLRHRFSVDTDGVPQGFEPVSPFSILRFGGSPGRSWPRGPFFPWTALGK